MKPRALFLTLALGSVALVIAGIITAYVVGSAQRTALAKARQAEARAAQRAAQAATEAPGPAPAQPARMLESEPPTLLASAQGALPQASADELVRAIDQGLWNTQRTALAIAIPRPEASLLFVFLQQDSEDYLPVDVSGLERANIGFIGPDRRYERIETTPLKWLSRDDGRFHIQMRTYAWSSGQRYTAAGTLLMDPDGTCLWQ